MFYYIFVFFIGDCSFPYYIFNREKLFLYDICAMIIVNIRIKLFSLLFLCTFYR